MGGGLSDPLTRTSRVKATASGRSISDVVDEALRMLLKEDAIDLAAFDARARQSTRPFEDVVKALKRDGLL